MKKSIYPKIILIFLILFGLNSCCNKKDCAGNNDYIDMYFYDFPTAEIDTIKIVKYEKNTNFSIAIDSTFEMVQFNTRLDYYNINYGIKTSESVFDYKIIVKKINREYTITGIELEEITCNSCFPYINQNEYNRVKSYFLNGVRQNDFQIVIYK